MNINTQSEIKIQLGEIKVTLSREQALQLVTELNRELGLSNNLYKEGPSWLIYPNWNALYPKVYCTAVSSTCGGSQDL